MSQQTSTAWTTCFSEGELHEIKIEVLIRKGLQKFDVIGLPQHMIKEGRDRILASLNLLGVSVPGQKILVSLSPASLRKEGSHFDLPILFAILKALGQVPNRDDRFFLWGELGLQGEVRAPKEFLPHWLFALRRKSEAFFSGVLDSHLQMIKEILQIEVTTIENAADLLRSRPSSISATTGLEPPKIDHSVWQSWMQDPCVEWDRLRGSREQFLMMTLISLGRHHALLMGVPGCGKTTWAHALKGLQTPLSYVNWTQPVSLKRQREISRNPFSLASRPFEAPHHSSSRAAIVGGGLGAAHAGAITRAHQGILFLDEFPEFARDALEGLREPLEMKSVSISRGQQERSLPADIQLICAMNLCRCGRTGTREACSCSTKEFDVYRQKVTQPLKDRIHLRAYWKFVDHPMDADFCSLKLKERFYELSKISKMDFRGVYPPLGLTPRRTRIWFELLQSWCRWMSISSPTKEDCQRFNHLISHFEEPHHELI